MRKHAVQTAAYEVAAQVRAVEETIDSALVEVAELQSRIMKINAVAGVGYAAVHPSLEKLASAVSRLVETRGAIVACHAELAEAKGKVPGLRTMSWGDGDDCDGPPQTGFADLRIVA